MNRIVRLGAALLLALALPLSNARADPDLTALINAAFPARVQDAGLHDLAHRRVVEIQSDFSHNGAQSAEVIAWNEVGIERFVGQWTESADHAAILLDSSKSLIGCAWDFDGTRYWAACMLGAPAPQPQPAPTPVPAAPKPTPNDAPGPAGQPSNVGGSGAQRTPLPAATPQPLPDTAMGR